MTTVSDQSRPSAFNLWRDRIAFCLFLVAVMLAPVPDGSVRLFWIVVWTGMFSAALLLASGRRLAPRISVVMLGLVGVVAAYAVVAWLQAASPGSQPDPIWALASKALGETLPPLSIAVQDASLLFLGRPLLFATVFACGLLFSGDSRRAQLIVYAVIAVALAGAAIGLFALAFDIKALRPAARPGAITAFFINTNTTGTYLGSAFLLVLALLLTRYMTALREGRSMRDAFLILNTLQGRLLGAALLALVIFLPLTLSRAGVIFTFAIAAGAVLILMAPRLPSRLPLVIGVLALFAVVYFISGQQWRVRQASVGFESEARYLVYEIMFRAALERPLLGIGLGTFAAVFPSFRTEDLGVSRVWDIGHSTPLELIFEGGFPLAIIVMAFLLVCGVILVRGVRRRPYDPIILAGLLVGLLGAIHSSVDFSLQMPGYAVIYMAVTGLGVGRALLPASEERVRVRQRRMSQSRAIQDQNGGGPTDAAPPPDNPGSDPLATGGPTADAAPALLSSSQVAEAPAAPEPKPDLPPPLRDFLRTPPRS